ncbi:hypothetical protein POP12_240 [Pectobacterium phage POP12]|nr:hypothetical protein POP12_240 [Pectobacterium phage POP12]
MAIYYFNGLTEKRKITASEFKQIFGKKYYDSEHKNILFRDAFIVLDPFADEIHDNKIPIIHANESDLREDYYNQCDEI